VTFAASLRFLQGFPATTDEQRIEGEMLTCAVRASGTTAGVRVSADGVGLRYEMHTDHPLHADAVAAVTDQLSFHLGLADDLGEFYALADGDPPFQRVIARLHGYHQVKFPSALELMCWAILAQRAPMPVARRMKQAIVTAGDNSIVLDGKELWAFPDLEQLLEISHDDLVELIGNRRKAGYLYGALRSWQGIDESFLRTGQHDLVVARLLEIPGIGPWSAGFLMVRGLGRTEKIAPDREARRAAGRVYGGTLTDVEFLKLAARYTGWQGYWSHYARVA
jgi:DNA-3-methyladenine glycosylase II